MIFFMVLIIIKVLIEIYIIFFKNFVTTQKAISTGVTILGGLGSIAAGSIFLGNSPVYCGPIQEWIQVNTPLAQGIIVSGLRYGYNEALKFELSPDDYSKMKEKIINDRREFDTSLVYQYIKDNPELVKKYPALQSKNFLINSIAKVSGLWNPALDLSAHELASQNHNLITEVEELRNELEIAKEKEILVKELLAENARIKAGLSKLLEDSLPKDMDIILKNKIKEDILHNLGHKDKYFNSIDLESEKLSTKK